MPIYVYIAKEPKKGCGHCMVEFEVFERGKAKALKKCPECGVKIRKVLSTFSKGLSSAGFDNKARDLGFKKLKKVDKGTYERQY